MRTDKTLIVSADEDLGQRIRWSLERRGSPSVLALDVVEAVRRIWQDRPACVVIDLLYPSIDPERIVRRARSCPETHAASIIALTDDLDTADEWLDRGCTLVLLRDSEPRVIAERVAACVLDSPAHPAARAVESAGHKEG
jgi:DNA-binding response OmpR family regulator